MRYLVLPFLLFVSAVHAEEQTISVPGEGWRIRFNAPKLSPLVSAVPSVYYGSSGRFQLSFFVEPPRCSGPDTYENMYACYLKRLLANQFILRESISGNTKANGVHVMSFAKIVMPNGVGTNFAMNLLFARNGKWANVHCSFASPTEAEVRELVAIMDSIAVEDEASSSAPAEAKPWRLVRKRLTQYCSFRWN